MTNHDKMALALSSIAVAVTVGFSLSAVEAAQTSAQNRIGQAQAEVVTIVTSWKGPVNGKIGKRT